MQLSFEFFAAHIARGSARGVGIPRVGSGTGQVRHGLDGYTCMVEMDRWELCSCTDVAARRITCERMSRRNPGGVGAGGGDLVETGVVDPEVRGERAIGAVGCRRICDVSRTCDAEHARRPAASAETRPRGAGRWARL